MDTDEGLYHATPQIRGRLAHDTIDKKTASNRKDCMLSLSVFSERYKLMGKIDVYWADKKLLVERKFQLKQIFQGQIYQLWGQYFCLTEMGYEVEQLAFYETSTNKMIYIPMPDEQAIEQFSAFIEQFHQYNPTADVNVNANKCRHCIYSNLCDKTDSDNVY